MLNYYKFIEILISLQTIIFSTMIPVLITLPTTKQVLQTVEIPITWQIPSVIVITLFFKGEVVLKAFTIYLFLGLLILPVFHQGGSLGYLLTPNFGYLLGIYPLIKIIDKWNNEYNNIKILNFIKSGILGITIMHIFGITYTFIQMLFTHQKDMFLYNISYYSLGKYGYHLLMLAPVALLTRIIKNIR